jgi:hypothetical protein
MSDVPSAYTQALLRKPGARKCSDSDRSTRPTDARASFLADFRRSGRRTERLHLWLVQTRKRLRTTRDCREETHRANLLKKSP